MAGENNRHAQIRVEATSLDHGFINLSMPRNITRADLKTLETFFGDILTKLETKLNEGLAHVPIKPGKAHGD